MRTLLILLLAVGLSHGFSGTIPPICDILADYGCSTWDVVDGIPDRLNCIEETPGIMPWVARPVHTEDFSLRAGDSDPEEDATDYIPGQLQLIYLRALVSRHKFRGVLLYAVDSSGNRVGEWSILDTDKHYWAPWADAEGDPCQNAVLHSSAGIKPYLSIFRFRGPPVGTGDITFLALIKTGDANTGEFWFPNSQPLTLSEGQAEPEPEIKWILSSVGQTCNDACFWDGRQCTEEMSEPIDSVEAFEELTVEHPCAYPILSGCDEVNPSTGTEEFCYYSNPSCSTPSRCSSSSDDEAIGQIFCPCAPGTGSYSASSSAAPPSGSASSSAPTPSGSASSSASGSASSSGQTDSSTDSEVISGAASLGLLGVALVARSRPWAVMLAVLFFSSSALGHNWVNSPSRTPSAATILPCQARRSSSPHVQVARNQHFQVEWASGHGYDAYFTLIRAEDADRMTEHHYTRLDAYLARSVAAGNNFAQDLLYRKYHRSPTEDRNDFHSIVLPTDPDFFERPSEFVGGWNGTGVLWRYSDEDIATDVASVGFQDDPNGQDPMPWILGCWRYLIPYAHPSDSDVALFWIPQGLGLTEGEYILQYYWRGYGDCIDISYLDRDEPVEFPYGLTPGETTIVYKRIDHCFFPDVPKYFGPPMLIYEDSVFPCADRCIRRAGCSGINVFPASLASSIYPGFRQPWDNIFHHQMNESLYPPGYIADVNPELQLEFREEEQKQALRDAWVNLPPDALLCLPVVAREVSSTRDKFELTEDPEDPMFYSTCYEFDIQIEFIGYNSTGQDEVEEGPWRFEHRCIDCEQRVRNFRDRSLPIWSIADECVNCDRNPADPASQPRENGGAIRLRNDNSLCGDNLEFCPDPSESCSKRMLGLGWGSGSGGEDHADPASCAALVRADPECSNHFTIFEEREGGWRQGCFCYKSLECCQECNTYSGQEGETPWEVDPPAADPVCATGVLSEDGQSCCNAGCSSCSPNSMAEGPGVCCSTCIFAERFCDEVGPPCLLR